MNKRHYVYEIIDKITGEFYWGSRSCKCDPKNDKYMGSMVSWKPNKENLIKRTIIEFNSREEATKAERIIIKFYINKNIFPLNRNYNIPGGIFAMEGLKRSFETNQKIIKSQKGKKRKPHTEEEKEKISKTLKEYYNEHNIWCKGKKLKPLSEEHKQKISNSNKGKGGIKNNKHGCANKGKIFTEEHKLKISESLKKYNKEKNKLNQNEN